MEGTRPRAVYEKEEVNNFRELLERVNTKFKDNVAYKYKKDATKKEPEYVEKTYGEYVSDVKALGTSLLELVRNKSARIRIRRKENSSNWKQ